MSDGPHRSLSMRRGWKKVANYASNSASVVEDVSAEVVEALKKDWQKEINPDFVALIYRILGETTLFSQDKIHALADLRQTFSGNAMSATLLEFLDIAVHDGKSGQAALRAAITRTMIDQSARCARQVEEHYLRKAGRQNARRVRQRIDEATQAVDFGSLTNELLDRDSKSARRAKKHDGVDDGVNL